MILLYHEIYGILNIMFNFLNNIWDFNDQPFKDLLAVNNKNNDLNLKVYCKYNSKLVVTKLHYLLVILKLEFNYPE